MIKTCSPLHPKYAGLQAKRIIGQGRILEKAGKRILNESQSVKPQIEPPIKVDANSMWIDEAVKYLGLDRIGIKHPKKAIHRLIKKGALSHKKVSGRLVFDKAEMDRVLANGDEKRGRGRPRKPSSA